MTSVDEFEKEFRAILLEKIIEKQAEKQLTDGELATLSGLSIRTIKTCFRSDKGTTSSIVRLALAAGVQFRIM